MKLTRVRICASQLACLAVASTFCTLLFAGKADEDTVHSVGNKKAAPSEQHSRQSAASSGFEIRYRETQALVASGELDKALKRYKKLARKFKGQPGPLNDIGVIYQLQGNLERAIKQFNLVIKRFPQYAPAYRNLADTLLTISSASYAKAAVLSDGDNLLSKKAELAGNFHLHALQLSNDEDHQQAEQRNSKPISQQVVNTMHSWINAWNDRDLRKYLSHYASDFKPAMGKSIEDWASRQKANFNSSDYIRVYLDSIEMEKVDEKTVSISFRELYESNLYENSANKEIVMVKVRNSWLIAAETQI